MGCVYFYKINNLDPIKVGMTSKNNPYDRIYQLITGAPFGGELLGYFNTPTPKKDETEIHERFKDRRLTGEWFDIDFDNVKELIKEFHTINDVKRLMLDFPFSIKEGHDNIKILTCLNICFNHVSIFSSDVDFDHVKSILIEKTNFNSKEIDKLNFKDIYNQYFNPIK